MKTEESLRLKILRDDHADSPRAWDNLGTMVCWHRKYRLGDERPKCDPTEWRESANLPEGTVILPLHLYDHGGITMSVGAFGDPWDSGQVGWIYATPDKIRDSFGNFNSEIVERSLRREVEVYASYLEGDVWRFTVERVTKCSHCGSESVEIVDNCGGFFGDDKDGIAESLSSQAIPLLDEAWDARE